jgi:lipoprotein-anchoring transpeptidase ErfK/SrfK
VAVVAAGVTLAVLQVSPAKTTRAAQATKPAAALRVLSITPAGGARGVDGTRPITVRFSAPVTAHTAKPVITPSVSGTWSAAGDTLMFVPSTPFQPQTKVTVMVPGGRDGVRSAAGGLLAQAVSTHFTTGGYTQLRLSELLAQLGYLPMTWTTHQLPQQRPPAGQALSSGGGLAGQEALAYDPPDGQFSWHYGYPSTLAGMWNPSQANVLLQGAVMAFDAQHGLPIKADLTPKFWAALFNAAVNNQANRVGYTYALVQKGSPETLTLFHNGHVVLRSLTNTGISAAPTANGTFPVYSRFLQTVMSGYNPDGSYYSDPVSFVSYFNGGDAVHYFPRGSYGFPQSLGCVELPYTQAQEAYPYLTYGSLVTVTG